MRFMYSNLDNPDESSETNLLMSPTQGMVIESPDRREWIVERVKVRVHNWVPRAEEGLPPPIVGVLYVRPVSNILETAKTPADFGLPVGSKLYFAAICWLSAWLQRREAAFGCDPLVLGSCANPFLPLPEGVSVDLHTNHLKVLEQFFSVRESLACSLLPQLSQGHR